MTDTPLKNEWKNGLNWGEKIMSSGIDVMPMLFESGKRRKTKLIVF